MAAQVDDVIDVLDRDRARLHAGAARHAVPDGFLGHRAGNERVLGLFEHVAAQTHDHELRREQLAGRERRAGVLTAPAFGAREGVEHLLPGQVGGRPRAEAQIVLALPLGRLEAQRLQAPARRRAPEPDVERGRRDVQVLGVRQVGDERALEHLRRTT